MNTLESYPELIRYTDLTHGWPRTGSFPEHNRPKWKRGRRVGADRRLRRLVRNGTITLSVILFANVQSLENKMDELHARISLQKDIQDCSILCFCETWLGESTPDEAITLAGYMVFREDRGAVESRKTRGRGTATLVKQSWYTDCEYSKLEDYYLNHSTCSMWQGIQTNYKKNH